jgi:dATP pyrophosphohydrolase
VFGLLLPGSIPVTVAVREHLNFAWLPWQEAAEKVFSSSNAIAIRELPSRYRR